MAGSGLFSGLKWTDIAIPAAGAVASAYNPYIGQGLQTGMNMFNTFSDFQNSLRQYKMMKEDRDLQEAHLAEGRGALETRQGILGGDIEGLRASAVLEEPVKQFTMFGPEGPRLPDAEAGEEPGFRFTDMATPAVTGEEPSALGLESVFSPAPDMSSIIELKKREALNEEIQAKEQLQADLSTYGGFMGLEPGVATTMVGQSLYRDLTGQFRDKERELDAGSALEFQQEMMKNKLVEKTWNQQAVEAQQEVYEASHRKQLADSLGYAESAQNVYDPNTVEGQIGMKKEELNEVILMLNKHFTASQSKEDPSVKWLMSERDRLIEEIRALSMGGSLYDAGDPAAPGGTVTVTGGSEAEAAAAEFGRRTGLPTVTVAKPGSG